MFGKERQKRTNNIEASTAGSLLWKCDQVQASLDELLKYVETEAVRSAEWYWRGKKWKARLSRWIRLWALLLTASAGLVPIVFYILRDLTSIDAKMVATSGLWASALVGVAAGLLGLDRAFGLSSGWARYVLTASEIRKRLEEFRMEWTALTASSGPNPSNDQIGARIEKAKEFRVAIEGIIAQETKDWVTEFQSNIAQLEKDVKAQVETLKAQIDKSQQAQQAASQPGSIEATIENADKTKDFTFSASLDGPDGAVVKDERTASSKTWARLNIKPGQYRLVIAATSAADKPASAQAVVLVKPAETAKPTIRLPIA